MPLSIFRISKVEERETTSAEDPYIHLGYYSNGSVGTSRYANEPVYLVAAERSNGYPGMRWMLLVASRQRIAAAFHTEQFDFYAIGRLTDYKAVGPAGMRIFTVTMNVEAANRADGGITWKVLQQAQVTQEAEPEEDGLLKDIWNLRGRKLVRRGAGWLWDQF